MIRKIVFAAAFALAIGACASEPAGPPAPVYLSDEQFQSLMRAPASDLPGSNYFGEERAITSLLERTDLSSEQRLVALMQRANLRGTIAENRIGAIADYAEVLRTAPADHRFIVQATERKAYAETQMGHINSRIDNPATARSQRFNDLLSAGRHDEAAQLFREGNVSAMYAVEKLHKLGYLCEGSAFTGPSYSWGYENTRRVTVRWCDQRVGTTR